MSAPLVFAVAAAESELRSPDYDLLGHHEHGFRYGAGRCPKRGNVAAEIFDDSADIDFAPGTVLFAATGNAISGSRIGRCRKSSFVSFSILPIWRAAVVQPTKSSTVFSTAISSATSCLSPRTRNRLIPRNVLIQSAVPRPEQARGARLCSGRRARSRFPTRHAPTTRQSCSGLRGLRDGPNVTNRTKSAWLGNASNMDLNYFYRDEIEAEAVMARCLDGMPRSSRRGRENFGRRTRPLCIGRGFAAGFREPAIAAIMAARAIAFFTRSATPRHGPSTAIVVGGGPRTHAGNLAYSISSDPLSGPSSVSTR